MNAKKFLQINKHKFFTIFLLYTILSVSLFFIVGTFDFIDSTNTFTEHVVLFSLKYGIPTAIVVFIFTLVSSFQDGKEEHRLIHEKPLNQLSDIGFTPILINQHTNWKFSKHVFGKIISYYPIKLSITEYKGITTISFIASYKRRKINLFRSSEIENNILKHNISFSRTNLNKSYSETELSNTSIKEIEQKLHEMIVLMKLYGLEPN